jgi:hypothetical protein
MWTCKKKTGTATWHTRAHKRTFLLVKLTILELASSLGLGKLWTTETNILKGNAANVEGKPDSLGATGSVEVDQLQFTSGRGNGMNISQMSKKITKIS